MSTQKKLNLSNPTVGQIVGCYLLEHGYQGLCSPGNCGCAIDDLMPCSCAQDVCKAGYRHIITKGNTTYWEIRPTKPEVTKS